MLYQNVTSERNNRRANVYGRKIALLYVRPGPLSRTQDSPGWCGRRIRTWGNSYIVYKEVFDGVISLPSKVFSLLLDDVANDRAINSSLLDPKQISFRFYMTLTRVLIRPSGRIFLPARRFLDKDQEDYR